MDKIDEILTRGIKNIIPSKKELEELLRSGKKLNVYLGVDPTATKIHLGNAVPLRKLQLFVDLGHNVTFLVGDFTALIGDTSDKEGERPILTYKEIQNNFKNYKEQASKLVDFSKIDYKFNGEWLKKLTFVDVVKLCQHFSIGDFIGRELIRKRLDSGKKVALHEVLYPVIQGYDSYYMDIDIQIGGADQTFNMQAGRTLQKDLRSKQSFVVVTDYLEGTDGRKMSKSWRNAVWLTDKPEDMYGKIMSLKDDLIVQYLHLATSLPIEQIDKKVNGAKTNPLDVKKQLAHQIVKELHSEKDADMAEEYFEKTFQKREPDYNKHWTYVSGATILDVVSDFSDSRSQAKRKISQGGTIVNDEAVNNPTLEINVNDKIKVGSQNFIKVVK